MATSHEAYRSPEQQETPQNDHEQSPAAFSHSLDMFNSYATVTPDMANKPEFQMPFSSEEQDVVVGVQGTLNEFAQQAAIAGDLVTVDGMFRQFDEVIRNRTDIDEATRDTLLLVSTKMKYHMEIRFDMAKRNEAYEEAMQETPIPTTSSARFRTDSTGQTTGNPFHSRDSSFRRGREWDDAASSSDAAGNDAPSPSPLDEHDQPAPTLPVEEPARNYAREATRIIYRETGGKRFETLDRADQVKILRNLAKQYHPDATGKDDELYAEILTRTPVKTRSEAAAEEQANQGSNATTTAPDAEQSVSPTAQSEPKRPLELETKPETQPQSEVQHRGNDTPDNYDTAA